jgi:hypothetical protein
MRWLAFTGWNYISDFGVAIFSTPNCSQIWRDQAIDSDSRNV